MTGIGPAFSDRRETAPAWPTALRQAAPRHSWDGLILDRAQPFRHRQAVAPSPGIAAPVSPRSSPDQECETGLRRIAPNGRQNPGFRPAGAAIPRDLP